MNKGWFRSDKMMKCISVSRTLAWHSIWRVDGGGKEGECEVKKGDGMYEQGLGHKFEGAYYEPLIEACRPRMRCLHTC